VGKIFSLLIGAILAVLGLILLVAWWYEFLFMVRGTLPLLLVIGGVIAVAAGFSELKDVVKGKSGK
jgi:hypothetical protein